LPPDLTDPHAVPGLGDEHDLALRITARDRRNGAGVMRLLDADSDGVPDAGGDLNHVVLKADATPYGDSRGDQAMTSRLARARPARDARRRGTRRLRPGRSISNQLIDLSEEIVVGEVVDSSARWQGKLVVTDTVVRVDEAMKGARRTR